jgi:hypothetical protein
MQSRNLLIDVTADWWQRGSWKVTALRKGAVCFGFGVQELIVIVTRSVPLSSPDIRGVVLRRYQLSLWIDRDFV